MLFVPLSPLLSLYFTSSSPPSLYPALSACSYPELLLRRRHLLSHHQPPYTTLGSKAFLGARPYLSPSLGVLIVYRIRDTKQPLRGIIPLMIQTLIHSLHHHLCQLLWSYWTSLVVVPFQKFFRFDFHELVLFLLLYTCFPHRFTPLYWRFVLFPHPVSSPESCYEISTQIKSHCRLIISIALKDVHIYCISWSFTNLTNIHRISHLCSSLASISTTGESDRRFRVFSSFFRVTLWRFERTMRFFWFCKNKNKKPSFVPDLSWLLLWGQHVI